YAFKNHQVLIRALFQLKQPSIALYLTLKEDNHPQLTALINSLGLSSQVYFLGPLSYAEVLTYYQSCTLVVFPSTIESFGLPLVECAMFGKPLVVVDAPYAHEVIGDYPKAIFASENNPLEWKSGVLAAIALAHDETPYHPSYDTDWSDVFKVIYRD
ncbi:MAG: glycosyltransferase, partial [Legionellaceae bacterium]